MDPTGTLGRGVTEDTFLRSSEPGSSQPQWREERSDPGR